MVGSGVPVFPAILRRLHRRAPLEGMGFASFCAGLGCAAGGSSGPFPGEAVGGCAEGASARLSGAAVSRPAPGLRGRPKLLY